MVMKLLSEDSKDIFMEQLKEGASYKISSPMLESGSEDIDSDFHLMLHTSCRLKETYIFSHRFHTQLKIPFRLQ